MNNSQCVILVPVANAVEPECEEALGQLEKAGYQVWRMPGCSAVEHARNLMATMALQKDFEELMWIDSDIVFTPADVDRLRQHELPLIGGLYARKGVPSMSCYWDKTQDVTFGGTEGKIELRYTGAGFLHTRREIYERVREREKLPECRCSSGQTVVPYFMPMIVEDETGNHYLPDDYSFCERIRRAGYKIMADTTIRLWHIGKYRYGWEDAVYGVKRQAPFVMKLEAKDLESK